MVLSAYRRVPGRRFLDLLLSANSLPTCTAMTNKGFLRRGEIGRRVVLAAFERENQLDINFAHSRARGAAWHLRFRL